MLQVIVSLEKRIAREEFDQDAANAPDVAWERPAESENDLWCAVVASRNDRGVVLVLEGSRSEINETNLSVEQDLSLACLAVDLGRRGWDSSVVCEGLVWRLYQEDVLWLKIGVD